MAFLLQLPKVLKIELSKTICYKHSKTWFIFGFQIVTNTVCPSILILLVGFNPRLMNKQNYVLICALLALVVGCQNTTPPPAEPIQDTDTSYSMPSDTQISAVAASGTILDTSMTFEEMGDWYGMQICNCGKSYFAYKEKVFEIEGQNTTTAVRDSKLAKLNVANAAQQLKDEFWTCRVAINDSLFLNMKAWESDLDYKQQQIFDARVLNGFDAAGCRQFPKVRQMLFKK